MSLLSAPARTPTPGHALNRVSGLTTGPASLPHDLTDRLAEVLAGGLVDGLINALPAALPAVRVVLVMTALIVEMVQHYRTRCLARTQHSAGRSRTTSGTLVTKLAQDQASSPDRHTVRAAPSSEPDPPAEHGHRQWVLATAAGILRAAAALATLLDALHQTGVL